MKDKGWTLTGLPALPVFLTLTVTPMLTALVISFPIAWLVNLIFSAQAIHEVFGVERLNYWRVVGMLAIAFATEASTSSTPM